MLISVTDKMCEGRIVAITGAGRGIGREYALMLADQGAKVVVNDFGGTRDGREAGASNPAQDVVDELTAAGCEAVAHLGDASSLADAEAMVELAIDTFGGLDVVVNNAGILRDRMLFSMAEEEWDSVIKVHLKGTWASSRVAAEYWRERAKAGEPNDAAHHQHHVGVGPLWQPGPDELRRRQGRHRRLHPDRRRGTRPLRRHLQRGRTGRSHPHDRGPPASRETCSIGSARSGSLR